MAKLTQQAEVARRSEFAGVVDLQNRKHGPGEKVCLIEVMYDDS